MRVSLAYLAAFQFSVSQFKKYLLTFSVVFFIPIFYLFFKFILFSLFQCITFEKPPGKILKKTILFQNLFWLRLLEKRFIQFSAFSLEFQKFVSNTRTIFSHSRPDYFWKQNTIPFFIWQWMPDHCVKWQTTNTTTICECANTCWLPSRWQQGYR